MAFGGFGDASKVDETISNIKEIINV